MKKNLYNIINEAEAKELEALLENVECEIPEGISAENIAAKVQKKQQKARAKARTLWIRTGAVAACFALIVAAVPTAQYFLGTVAQTTTDTELGLAITPSIGYPTSISFMYYFPLKDGTCLAKEITHTLDNGKLYMTWKDHLAIFFEHCELDVVVANWELTIEGEKTESDGQTVTHTPGVKTIHIYLEGEDTLDDHTLKCLVNTIDSLTYARYIKLYYNGAPVAIEGACPEEGFINFK
jgi:hypothetical protein